MTFCTKLLLVQNLCVLCPIIWMGLLETMVELNIFSHNYAKIKTDSVGDLPLEKTLTKDSVVMRIKSFYNKNQNHHYYIVFLEKCSYQLNVCIYSLKKKKAN